MRRCDKVWGPWLAEWQAATHEWGAGLPDHPDPEHLSGPEWGALRREATTFLKRITVDAARYAHEEAFESNSGDVLLGCTRLLIIYNNHPYAGYPLARDEELRKFKAWLADRGLNILFFFFHPADIAAALSDDIPPLWLEE